MKIHSKSIFARAVSFLLVVVITMSMIAVGTFMTSAAAAFTVSINTTGTSRSVTVSDNDGDGYYEIYTADELDAFSYRVNYSSSYRHICAELMADIVYNEGVMTANSTPSRRWIPIGSSTQVPFRGKFLGNNHSISGLYFNSSSECAGLFGYINELDSYVPHIENLIVKNSYFKSGNYCGAIAARFQSRYGDSTMTNCASINNIIDNAGRSYCGGIVGYNQGSITNCYSTTTVNATGSYVGAIVGQQSGTVTNCYYLAGTSTGGINGKDIAGQAEAKTAEEFASGEVAYLLQEAQNNQTTITWGQTIGEDPLPLFGDDKVYYTNLTCAEDSPLGYTNTLDPQHVYETVVTPPTPYDRGYTTHTCSGCGHTYIDGIINPTNVGGDAELFEKVAPQGAHLFVNPTYAVDEAIYVTAVNGVWVGLYPSTVTNPSNKTDAIYTYQLDGKGTQCFDMRSGLYNPSNTASVRDCLNMGETYNVFLFSDSEYTVAASASFSMTADNEVKVSDTTYLQTDRKTYTYGETMLLNANASDNEYAWVGVYPKDSANSTTPAEYIIYIGSSFSPSYAGQPVDIINSSHVNNGAELLPGDYDVCLFGDKTMNNVLAKLTISVRAGFISTDKKTYGYGEKIIAKANLYNSAYVDVSNTMETAVSTYLYKGPGTTYGYYYQLSAGTVVTVVGTSGTDTNNWVCVNDGTNTGYVTACLKPIKGSDVKVYGYAVGTEYLKNAPVTYTTATYRIATLLDGTAINYLDVYSGNSNYLIAQYGGYSGYFYRTSTTSTANIKYVHSAHDNSSVNIVDHNAWVGLYDKGTTPGTESPSDAWYYLRQFPGSSVVLQSLASGDGTTYAGSAVIEAGEHTLNLFGDGDYTNWLDDADFTVSNKVTGSFKSGAYKVITLNDGFANGTVALELSDDSLGYIGTGEAIVYWADANGNLLEGYAALANQKITASVFTFDMYPHTIIPEGAMSLVAYVSYNGMKADTSYTIPLPENCKAYENLDSDIISEFQVVSDLHITSDVATSGTEYNRFNANYQAMLADITATSPNSVGIFVNGDVANNGLSEEYGQLKSMNTLAGTIPQMYVTMGNHDASPGNITDYIEFATSLGADISADKPYYSKTINGYKYIFLASDVKEYYGLYNGADHESAKLSSTQLSWLEAELSDNEKNNAGKPVFIMMHQPVANSVAGSFTGQWASDKSIVNASEFKAVVSKYNNVFLLSSHSHYDLNCEGNHNPGDENLPVTLNTAAVSFLRTNVGDVSGSQGFYVRVYNDKVVFLGRDFANNKWIPSACYVFCNGDISAKYDQKVLRPGEELNSSEYITNTQGKNLTFKSSDTSVVTVDAQGKISTSGKGNAVVYVTAAATNTEVVTKAKIQIIVPVTTTADITYLYTDRRGDEQSYIAVHTLSDDEILGFEGNNFTPYAPAHISGQTWTNSVLKNSPHIVTITEDIAWTINSDTYNAKDFVLRATQTDTLFTITSQAGDAVVVNQKAYGELLTIDARKLDKNISGKGFWYNDTDNDGKYTDGTDLMLTYGPRYSYRVTCDMNINFAQADKYDFNITIDAPAYGRKMTTATDGTVTDKITVDYIINILTPYFYGNDNNFVPSDDINGKPDGQHVTIRSLRDAGYTVKFGVILEQVGSFAPGSTAYPTYDDALTAAKAANYGTATNKAILAKVAENYTAPTMTEAGTYCTIYDYSDYNISNKNRFGFTIGFNNTAANHKKFYNVYSYVTVTTPENVTTTYISNVQTLNIYNAGTPTLP